MFGCAAVEEIFLTFIARIADITVLEGEFQHSTLIGTAFALQLFGLVF